MLRQRLVDLSAPNGDRDIDDMRAIDAGAPTEQVFARRLQTEFGGRKFAPPDAAREMRRFLYDWRARMVAMGAKISGGGA